MSTVLWCDYGNHSFKANSPGSAHFNGTEVNEDGLNVSVSMDACSDHRPDRVRPDYIAKELQKEYPIGDVGGTEMDR